MITIKALLIIASISIDVSKGLFKYPCDNISDQFIAGGSSSEYSRRICTQSAAAMWGTLDGAISRFVIPSLTSYAGARKISSIEQMRDADWVSFSRDTEVTGIVNPTRDYPDMRLTGNSIISTGANQSKDELWYSFVSNRTLQAKNRSFVSPINFLSVGRVYKINSLIDNYILGDNSGEGWYMSLFNLAFEGTERGFLFHWLYDANGSESASISQSYWGENFSYMNPFTGSYLLTIGELSKNDFLGEWRYARIGDGIAVTTLANSIFYDDSKPWPHDFIFASSGGPNGFPVDESLTTYVYGEAFSLGETNESIRARGKKSVAELMYNQSGIDFTTFTNRPSRRIWKERIAFANSLLSLMSRTVHPLPSWPWDYTKSSTQTFNEFEFVYPWFAPNWNFAHESYHIIVNASMTRTLDDDSYFALIKTDPEDYDVPPENEYSFFINLDDYSDPELFIKNRIVSLTTNYTREATVCGWREEEGMFYVDINAYANIYFSDFDVSESNIVDTVTEVDKLYQFRIERHDDRPLIHLYIDDRLMSLGTWDGTYPTTNWSVILNLSYNGDISGSQFLETAKTSGAFDIDSAGLSGKDYDELVELTSNDTILPPKSHQLTDSMIKTIKLNTIEYLAVSTNDASIEAATSGSPFGPGEMYDKNFDTMTGEYKTKQDCWLFGRKRNVANPRSMGEMISHLYTLFDYSNIDMLDGLSLLPFDIEPPTKDGAQNVSNEDLISLFKEHIENGLIGANFGIMPNTLDLNLYALKTAQDPLAYYRMISTTNDADKIINGIPYKKFEFEEIQRLFIDTFTMGGSKVVWKSPRDNESIRKTCAIQHIKVPHAVVDWKFPILQHK